jgi:hypothetical protein
MLMISSRQLPPMKKSSRSSQQVKGEFEIKDMGEPSRFPGSAVSRIVISLYNLEKWLYMHKEYCEYKGSGKIARSCFSCFSCFGDRHVARDSDASGQHSAKSSNCQTAKLPTWENILRHFWLKNLYISDQTANFEYVQIIVVLRNGRRRHTRGSVRKKRGQERTSTYPEGSLSHLIRLLTRRIHLNPPHM